MNKKDYTEEQVKDYQERRMKALKMLADMHLNPVAQLAWNNLGDDTFTAKVIVDLADTKFIGGIEEAEITEVTEAPKG